MVGDGLFYVAAYSWISMQYNSCSSVASRCSCFLPLVTQPPFYNHYTGQPVLASTSS